MRKIRIIEHISLDGVIQAPGGPDEDRDGDFKYGGWSHGYSGLGEAIDTAHGKNFDLLLGRHVYDIWAPYWPTQNNGIADSFNAATKYVVTHRPESLQWGPVEAIGGDIVESIRRVKSKDGGDLIVWGSSTLTSVLLGHGLVDEVVLFVYPVLLGTGKRFFTDVSAPRQLALVSTKATSSGVIVSTYKPVGALRTGSY